MVTALQGVFAPGVADHGLIHGAAPASSSATMRAETSAYPAYHPKPEKTTLAGAFALADQVLYSGVACISDPIVKEGLINLDFADVLAVMREKGKAMMGRGEASGEKHVLSAAVAAISNPLIEDPSIKRATGLIISITGGRDLTLLEVDEAATRIREQVDQDANVIVGATFDESLHGIVRVSVVATGIDNVGATLQAQPSEHSFTELAGRLRHESHAIAEGIGPNSPPPQLDNPRPHAMARHSEERPAKSTSAYPRNPASQGPDPYSLSSAARNSIKDDVLEVPAFLPRKVNRAVVVQGGRGAAHPSVGTVRATSN